MNEVLKAIQDRRSTRGFSDVQLTDAELQALVDAALAAPTARNAQSWHFSVVQNQELLDAFCREAAEHTDDIIARGKLPVIVGGTGLYIDSLISGRDFADEPGDTGLREKLCGEYDALGGEAMLSKLRSFDPERAAKLHPGDKRRIVRAIEVYELTGETITAQYERT